MAGHGYGSSALSMEIVTLIGSGKERLEIDVDMVRSATPKWRMDEHIKSNKL